MNKMRFASAMLLLFSLQVSCTSSSTQQETTQPAPPMTNLVSIIEIPAIDLSRAMTFYRNVLNIGIEEAQMGDVRMGIFPTAEGAVNVVLASGPDYVPTTQGVLLYWQAGEDLQAVLDRIELHGGKIILPKTAISAEMGFYALFTDTEGNKMGLHGMR